MLDKLIKKRPLKTKNHRIYLQDKELLQTNFKPGEKISFIFDKENKSLKITPSKEGSISVSKRNKGTYINPIIDIRKKEVLNNFNDCSLLEVEIFENEILIKGYTEIKEESIEKEENIININEKLYKKQIITTTPKELDIWLKKASGDNYNLLEASIDNCVENIISAGKNIHYFDDNTSISENIFKSISKKAIKAISFCSGIGALDKGFIDTGFDIIFGVDFNKDAVETYKNNIGDHIIYEDINNIPLNNIPDAELLIAGSPCQDLSNANRVTGKILDSPKNLIIRRLIDIAKHTKSLKVMVLENVPQLLTKGKKFVDEIKERLSDFEITINKVNSYDFGSPQKRERAIVIASKIGKIKIKPPNIISLQTVRDAFKGLNDNIPNQLDFTIPKKTTIEKMKYIKPGGNFKDIPENLRTKGVHSNSYKRLEWSKPSITITNVRKSNILHPEENRVLSVRECCRLFDLPDDFIIYGTLANKQQVIANAVPYKLSYGIAKIIKDKFNEFYCKRILARY